MVQTARLASDQSASTNRADCAARSPFSDYLRAAVPNETLQLDDVVLTTGQFLHLMQRGIHTRLLSATKRRPGACERGNIARQAVRIFVAGYKAGKCADETWLEHRSECPVPSTLTCRSWPSPNHCLSGLFRLAARRR
ncbi:TetR/AcrR family transcriptional regulator C-terminal domain-containing protein [Paraburkholderia fungorum]|uniref:TetR/AcrR family transcriptional regulator C-terminal domain-containing protein n=1 Tax=Paraburkholderia fungorum TaxID=134537 RepID=UPI0038BD5605